MTEKQARATQHSVSPLIDVLLIYVSLFGKTPTREAFLTGLPNTDNDLSVELGIRALKRFGLVAEARKLNNIKPEDLPLCALMKDGSWKILVKQKGDAYVTTDGTVKGGIRYIKVDAFHKDFASYGLQARTSLEELQRRHVDQVQGGHWFWGKFKGQSKLIRDIIIGSFVANIIAVAVSLFALQVYDRVIPNQSEATLWVLVAGVGIAIAMEASLKIARSNLMDVSGKQIELQISQSLFEKFMGMRLSSRPATPGSLIYSIREFSSVREFFTAASVGTIADLPFVFVFLLLVYGIAGPVVWVLVIAMLMIILPSYLAQGKMSKLAEEMQGGASAANKLLIETGYALDTIKSNRSEGFFQRKWEEITLLNAAKTTEQRSLAARLTFLAASMQQLAYVFAVVVGVYFVFSGDFTIGTVIAVSILSGRILAPATQLSGMLSRWQQVKSSMIGLEMIMQSEQERPIDRKFSRKEIFDGAIGLKNTMYAYEEDAPNVLQVADLKIDAGKKVALLGSNGSGKSTLLNLLSGLYSPTSGKIFIDELDVEQLDPEDVRRNIGYVSQDVKLFSGTLRDNLLLGQTNIEETEIFKAVDFSGIGAHVRKHPLGLDMVITDGGAGLSTGQRQSVGLARLYLQDPRIVLLDEPTASLDQPLELQLIKRLKSWLGDRTCIISTHRTPVLEIVDDIVVLANGSIAMYGDRKTIIQKLKSNQQAVDASQENENAKRISA